MFLSDTIGGKNKIEELCERANHYIFDKIYLLIMMMYSNNRITGAKRDRRQGQTEQAHTTDRQPAGR